MNILIATDVFPPKSGGSGWSTFYLARALQARGHLVEVALPQAGQSGLSSRVYQGIHIVDVGYTYNNIPALRAWQRTHALEQTFAAYLAQRARAFDLIHAQHMLSIGAATVAKKASSIPVVSTVRDYWAVCLYGTLLRANSICPICHGSEITRCLAQKYGPRARYMRAAVPFVERELRRRQQSLKDSDAVIAVSDFVRETLREVVTGEALHVVPNLIDADETAALAASVRPKLPPGGRYLMFIGKLNIPKGADLLPFLMEHSGAEIPLVVAGDGELAPKLAGVRGLDLRGWLSNAETLALLARAQGLVFPSRWADPLARTLLEAQALGVPTVALKTGGTRDIIQDNFNGLLAPDAVGLAVNVRRILQDSELGERLGKNARQVALDKFSPDIVVRRLEEIYADVTYRRTSANIM